MARDRQRAKQRQAERRAARQAQQGERSPGARRPGDGTPDTDGSDAGRADEREAAGVGDGARRGAVAPPGMDAEHGADLVVGAPPEDIGRSDTFLEADEGALDADPELDSDGAAAGEAAAERGDAARHGKVIAFLIAVWAELKRVQWPNRQQMTTLTGIVLGFVVIMGAYLGALDAVFSRLVQLVI